MFQVASSTIQVMDSSTTVDNFCKKWGKCEHYRTSGSNIIIEEIK